MDDLCSNNNKFYSFLVDTSDFHGKIECFTTKNDLKRSIKSHHIIHVSTVKYKNSSTPFFSWIDNVVLGSKSINDKHITFTHCYEK